MGADHRTLATETAGIDHFVGLSGALDNGLIIINLTGQCFGIFLEFPKIGALFDTFQTLTMNAAASLPACFFVGITGVWISRKNL